MKRCINAISVILYIVLNVDMKSIQVTVKIMQNGNRKIHHLNLNLINLWKNGIW